MIGTVAGDDTVLVVAAEDSAGRMVASRLAELAGVRRLGADGTRPDDAATDRDGAGNGTEAQ